MPGQADLAIIPRDPKYQGFRQYQIAQFGLDKTPLEQFVIYLQKLFTLDWGVSYFYKKPVIGILAVDLSWTLLLVGTATIFTVLIGMAIGSYAAVRRGKPFDYLSTGFAIFFYGMPIFWLGIMLQTAFKRRSPLAAWFSWWPQLPVQGYFNNDLVPWQWDWTHVYDAALHLILPAATLALGTIAGISLVMRSSLIDVMTEDFVTTAKAKGLTEAAVLRRHILPNGLPPMVSLIALDVAFILGGAYQVEYVFNYKGIGYRTIEAIGNLDFPLLQFIIVIGGAAVVIANLISDFLLLLLDPRIKIS
ncbi:MAG: ABC transporter permease [Methanobacteriota archaeon]|nr:MAG: ABC transporter permease [Euryarchaeota archaeon]